LVATSDAVTRTVNVADPNNPPAATASSGDTTYTENAVAIVVDAGINLSDDGTNLSSATVGIVGAGRETTDVLTFATQAGITGLYDAQAGVLSLSGTATVAQYQAALRTITYHSTSDNPSTGARSVEFVVNDGAANSPATAKPLVVTPVNDAPVVTLAAAALNYTGPAAATLDGTATVTDVDGNLITGATVTISNGYVNGEDELVYPAVLHGVTGAFLNGTLTLTGNATAAQYQAIVRSIQFRNVDLDPTTGARTISVSLTDNGTPAATSTAATRTVNVANPNNPPIVTASAGTTTYQEDAILVVVDPGITVTDSDSLDITGATVRIVGAGFTSGEEVLEFTPVNGIDGNYNNLTGVLTFTGTVSVAAYQSILQSITYRNTSQNPNTGARSVRFVVNDGVSNSEIADRPLAVTAVNDAPVVNLASSQLAYSGPSLLLLDAALTVSDPEGNNITGGTVAIGNFVAGQDELTFNNTNGVSGSFSTVNGVLTMTGSATTTAADFQAFLRDVRFRNASATPTQGARPISIVLTDNGTPTASNTAVSRTINVGAPSGGGGEGEDSFFSGLGGEEAALPYEELTDGEYQSNADDFFTIVGE
jgi:hypothetical protein